MSLYSSTVLAMLGYMNYCHESKLEIETRLNDSRRTVEMYASELFKKWHLSEIYTWDRSPRAPLRETASSPCYLANITSHLAYSGSLDSSGIPSTSNFKGLSSRCGLRLPCRVLVFGPKTISREEPT